jgi:hypothetical protein
MAGKDPNALIADIKTSLERLVTLCVNMNETPPLW